MIENSEKESKTSHGTGALKNKSQGLIVLKVSLFVFARFTNFFSSRLGLFQGTGLTDQPSRGPRLIKALTETLIKRDVTKSETNLFYYTLF